MNKINISRTSVNFFSLISAQVIYKIFTFAMMIVMARYLGPQRFGVFSYASSIVWIFLFISDFGFAELFIRDVAPDRVLFTKYVNNIVTLKIFVSLAVYAVIIILNLIFISRAEESAVILILGISVILDSFMYFFRSAFRVKETMQYEGALLVAESALKFCSILLVIYLKLEIPKIILVSFGLLFVSIVNLIINWFIFKLNYKNFYFTIDGDFWLYLLKTSFPFAAVYILTFLSFRSNIIMLSLMKGSLAAGWYSVDFKLLEQFLIIPATIASVYLPLLSRLSSSPGKVNSIVRKTALPLIFAGLLSVGFLYFCGGYLIRIIFGSGFAEAGSYLFIVSLVLPFFFIKPVVEKLLYILNKQGEVFRVYIAGIAVNIILSWILIPAWDVRGVAASTFISEALIIISLISIYKKHRYSLQNIKPIDATVNSLLLNEAV